MPFVVIRLRSSPGALDERCIHVSNINTLTVENSKTHQDFTFDMIASENISQFTIFNSVVNSFQETIEKALTTSQYRMDHLVMGYGQSGSGKSYTLFGERRDEGILPLLIDRLNQEGYELKMRAFEIYNEQFYDLLINIDKNHNQGEQPKNIEIRQDLEKGVHIEGLQIIDIPKSVPSINIIEELLNYKYSQETPTHDDRKSHKSITLYIKHTKFHASKQLRLHFVELASCDGQRQYFTKRPSISINKSLNTLNVILSNLMDVANGKPKKHIPFRDSKLTFYLKDMLSSSSSNKWVFTSLFMEKSKLPESINSLMFAKRAKCLVEGPLEVQQEKTARKNNIRMQVKMMRQQLQNSRFIHGRSIDTEWEYPQMTDRSQKSPMKMANLSPCKSRMETQQQTNRIDLLCENELQFRHIIKMYQQRISYLQNKQQKKQIIKGIYNQKRLLENLNHKYAKLVLNFPAFANIIAQNQKLKSDISLVAQQLEKKSFQISQMHSMPILNSLEVQRSKADNQILKAKLIYQDQIMSKYQRLIEDLKGQVRHYSEQMKVAYEVDLKNERNAPHFPNKVIRTIENENDCLKLTILTQEEEIERLHKEYSFISVEIRAITEENRALMFKNQQLEQTLQRGGVDEFQLKNIISKLLEIKASAENDQCQISSLIATNRELEIKAEECKIQDYGSVYKNSNHEVKVLCKDNQVNRSIKFQSENKNLKRQAKDSEDKKVGLQRQLSKLSSRVAELNRQISISKETELSLYQQLTNANEKVKALETKQKIQTQKNKQYNLEMVKLKRELQGYTEKNKTKYDSNRSESQLFEEHKDLMMNKRLSLARKGGSDFDAITSSKSTKCLETQKSLNATAIFSAEKLCIIMEPPRISSGRKVISKEIKKEKQKQIKTLPLKSKQIKNSIVQKM